MFVKRVGVETTNTKFKSEKYSDEISAICFIQRPILMSGLCSTNRKVGREECFGINVDAINNGSERRN